MHRTRVGVIRGGPSTEHEVSLRTGSTVLKHLSQDKYNPREIYIDRSGKWHINGIHVLPHDALNNIDVVFNALHGSFGEDGKIQHILERHGIPYTGSNPISSAVGMNKKLAKEVYSRMNLKTPQYRLIDRHDKLNDRVYEVFRAFPLPFVVKPVSGGSSIGITIVRDFKTLSDAVQIALEHGDSVLVEEYISGKEATCGVIDHFRNTISYALPPIEIRPKNSSFFDYDAKYAGESEEIVPGNFTDNEKREIEKMAIEAHNAIGLKHYSRSDFIIHPHRGIYILETNSLPGLTEQSLLPKALNAVGASLGTFLDHIIQLAITRK